MLVVISTLGMISRGMESGWVEELEIGGRNETIETTALLMIGQNAEERPEDLLSL